MFDYLIVGSGLFGAVFAHEKKKKGKRCLVLERRSNIGGNIRCEKKDGINLHIYGAHVFHTNNKMVWQYVNQFVEFNNYINSPMVNYRGNIYNLPFNMNTFHAMWGVVTPEEAIKKISEQCIELKGEAENLEEYALSKVGRDIYEKMIKGYTEKQWGKKCSDLPASIIKRLPIRYNYDNNYYDTKYQGVPIGGYNKLIEGLFKGIEVHTNIDYIYKKCEYERLANKILYTGMLDEYYNYKFGCLDYRGLNFETKRIEKRNYQGVAVMNYTAKEIPFTRIIEHKHFEFGNQPITYITKEYPRKWSPGEEAYYPVNDERNRILYAKYVELANREKKLILGGRQALYKYFDMDKIVELSLKWSKLF